jgi:hypothetical protein
MPVVLELPPELLERLRAEALRRDVSVAELVADLVATLPAPADTTRRPGFIGIGSSTTGRSAREADEMLAEGFGRE